MSVLYFAHIPKTAGTAVTAALDAAFAAGAILPAMFTTELEAARPAFARARVARGHLGADLHERIGASGPTFTLLRPPLERVLSHIAHVLRDELHPLHRYVRERGHGVAGFVGDPRLQPYITNLQARHLVQPAGTAAPDAEALVGDHPAAGQVAYELAPAGAEDELLAQAQAALDAMVVVGTTEDVDGALRRLATALGWRDAPRAERRNAAPAAIDPASIDTATRDTIVRLNRVDQALYDGVGRHTDAPPPETWTWHPYRATGEGWEDAEFAADRGWLRRIGPTGEARAVFDGPGHLEETIRGAPGTAVTAMSRPAR